MDVLYHTASLTEQLVPVAVAFWTVAAVASIVATPIVGLESLAGVGMGALCVAYVTVVGVAARRLRIATQPPTARPTTDLREEVTL